MLDAVNAELDVLQVAAMRKYTLKPLDFKCITVLKTRLLLNNRKLLDLSCSESQGLHAEEAEKTKTNLNANPLIFYSLSQVTRDQTNANIVG